MKWTHIIIEAYCGRKWSPCKSKYHYRIIGTSKDVFKTKKILNPKYDPAYRTPRKPSYCKNEVCYTCLEKECPHLCYCNANDDDYKMFFQGFQKRIDDETKKNQKNNTCQRQQKSQSSINR